MSKFSFVKESTNETVRVVDDGEERTVNQISYRVLDESGNDSGNATWYNGSENLEVNFRFNISGVEVTDLEINVSNGN